MWNFSGGKRRLDGKPSWSVSGPAAMLYGGIGCYFIYATIRYLTAEDGALTHRSSG